MAHPPDKVFQSTLEPIGQLQPVVKMFDLLALNVMKQGTAFRIDMDVVLLQPLGMASMIK